MPSVLPGYEYDIFISYRHNDNRTGWVAEFVSNLQKELEAAVKGKVNIYFDANPHDGLAESHQVDASLGPKLRSLIFIPIISKTYCDPESFAWRQEFIPFNTMASDDQLGIQIKLKNRNIASRILPIRIHDLDSEDQFILEKELKGKLRSIDFVFKSIGVNRPLLPDDIRSENKYHHVYRDQINKVANAIGDIISVIRNPSGQNSDAHDISQPSSERSKLQIGMKKGMIIAFSLLVIASLVYGFSRYSNSGKEIPGMDRSIAVLPFTDMSPEKDQEYLGDGIAEQLINSLTRIDDLKVIGRTSSFQFKDEKIDLRDIGERLQVSNVLEGSVQKIGENVRISVQLINVVDGSQLWSERYDRKMNHIFAVQDEISQQITRKLKLSLLKKGPLADGRVPTENMEAYEMYLKGNLLLRQGPAGGEQSAGYFEKAVALDSSYIDAYFGIAWASYFGDDDDKMRAITNKLQHTQADSPELNDLLLTLRLWREWDWEESTRLYENARASGFPATITQAYYEGIVKRDLKKAIQTLREVVINDPLFMDALRNLARFYIYDRRFEDAHMLIGKMLEIDPQYSYAYDLKATAYFHEGKYEDALQECVRGEEVVGEKTIFIPLRISILAKTGNLEEANKLLASSHSIDFVGIWRLADIYITMGRVDDTFDLLKRAADSKSDYMHYVMMDPKFDPIRNDKRFVAIVKKMGLPYY
jgi:TolB-like protein/tetratricopeptide (TPR) repeat protein